MTWKTVFGATPYGFAGGLLFAGFVIGVNPAEFNFFSSDSGLKVLSAFIGGFIIVWGAHLNALRMPSPRNDEEERRVDVNEMKKLLDRVEHIKDDK